MGTIDPRLERLYSVTRSGVALPVIVQTATPPTQAMLAQAQAAGAGPIRFTSPLGNAYGTTATLEVAQRLAALPSTVAVFYDEPISPVGVAG